MAWTFPAKGPDPEVLAALYRNEDRWALPVMATAALDRWDRLGDLHSHMPHKIIPISGGVLLLAQAMALQWVTIRMMDLVLLAAA